MIGLRVGAGRDREPRGGQGRDGRPVLAASQMPVLRQAGRVAVVPRGQRLGQAPVQAPPFAWQQVGVDHLLDQRVPEGVSVIGGDQQPRVRPPAGPRRSGRLPTAAWWRRARSCDSPPSATLTWSTTRPGRGGRADALASTTALIDGGGPSSPGVRQLLGVQRIALGRAHDGGDLLGARARRDQPGHQLGDLGIGQTSQRSRVTRGRRSSSASQHRVSLSGPRRASCRSPVGAGR